MQIADVSSKPDPQSLAVLLGGGYVARAYASEHRKALVHIHAEAWKNMGSNARPRPVWSVFSVLTGIESKYEHLTS